MINDDSSIMLIPLLVYIVNSCHPPGYANPVICVPASLPVCRALRLSMLCRSTSTSLPNIATAPKASPTFPHRAVTFPSCGTYTPLTEG